MSLAYSVYLAVQRGGVGAAPAGRRRLAMQRTDAASKKQMLAYLLASLAKCMARIL